MERAQLQGTRMLLREAEIPVDQAEPGIDERRRNVHERAQASIEEMRDSGPE